MHPRALNIRTLTIGGLRNRTQNSFLFFKGISVQGSPPPSSIRQQLVRTHNGDCLRLHWMLFSTWQWPSDYSLFTTFSFTHDGLLMTCAFEGCVGLTGHHRHIFWLNSNWLLRLFFKLLKVKHILTVFTPPALEMHFKVHHFLELDRQKDNRKCDFIR